MECKQPQFGPGTRNAYQYGVLRVWEDTMSDEIKEHELVNAGEEKQLDEKVLDEVVGGATATTASNATTDSASPSLFKACCAGAHVVKANIEL
jgi:type VI protein secretion system component Hcp